MDVQKDLYHYVKNTTYVTGKNGVSVNKKL